MVKYTIYKITSPSGMIYIGQTKNWKQRESVHRNTWSKCLAIKNSIRKYGWDNMAVEFLLEDITVEEANIFESYYIDIYGSLAPNGYNMTTGGENYHRAKESIERINKNPEKIKKTAEKHRGTKRSDDSKLRMSLARSKFIARNGGPQNKGHKIFYNPNHPTEQQQFSPGTEPPGWERGNRKLFGLHKYYDPVTKIIKMFTENGHPEGWLSWNPNIEGRRCII